MPVIYSNTADGTVYRFGFGAWSGIRGATAGSSVYNATLTNSIMTDMLSTAFGVNTIFIVTRSFFYFDTSGITGNVDSVDIEIYGHALSGLTAAGKLIAVKSNAFGGDGGSALAIGDFDAMPGWNGSADATGNVTDYSTVYDISSSSWSLSGYNSLTGTSDLKTDMKNNNIVIICILNYDYDYKNVIATPILRQTTGWRTANYGGTTSDPRLNYTLATSSGYANTVKGVATANIGTVKGVATANISKVIGV